MVCYVCAIGHRDIQMCMMMIEIAICILGNTEDKGVPTLVQGLTGHKIIQVELGSGDAHTLALEDNGESCSVLMSKVR